MMSGSLFENLKARETARILAIRLDNIGDVVMLSPALRALKEALPSAHLTLMASPAGSQAAPMLPWVDDLLTWRAVWQDIVKDAAVDIKKERELVRLLEKGQFDAAFIFTSFSQSPYPPAYACYLAGIPFRVGQSKEFGGALLTHWVKPLPDFSNQTGRSLHLLRSVGIPVESDHLELHVSEEYQRRAEALLAALRIGPRDAYIALAPGASAAARRFDERRFAEAAAALADASSLPIVLIGSPREVGKFPTLEALPEANAKIHSLIGKTSLAEMIAIIQNSALLIGNNSGSLHIATAFNRPMVILYSGTEYLEQWAPQSKKYTAGMRFLYRTVECSPCFAFQCPYQMECLDIPPKEIVTAALELLRAEAPTPKTLTADHHRSVDSNNGGNVGEYRR